MKAARSLVLQAFACALVATLVSSTALAQVGRYKRKTMKVQVKKTEKTAKLKPREKTAAQKKEELRPEITADQFMQVETKVQAIRDEQIEEYMALIKDTDADDSELPDLYFRVAELFAQKQRYWRFQGMEQYAKIDATKSKAKKSELKRKQKKYFGAEKKWLIESIKAYRKIADNPRFREYPRMDEALFFYAFTLQSAKYLEQARKIYRRLIKDYPSSKYIPTAYLAFADYFYKEGQLGNAEKFYDKVLQFPKSSVYAYAMFMKGWVHLNNRAYQDALETFFQVAKLTRKGKKWRSLNRASKKDFVRAYAEVGKPQLAYKAFQRVDKKYAFTMLEILGDLYLAQGKAEKTIFVFHELLGLAPKHKQACEWQYTVVRAMLTVGKPSQRVKEVERMVKLFLKYKEGNILPETELMECEENAQATTSELARIWHVEAQKTLNVSTLQYVDSLYRLYVDSFPEADDYGEMQYYYGELLWSRAENEKNPRLATERWETVAKQFTSVVKSGKVKDKMMKESAYAAVLGWKNALAVDPRKKAPPPPKKTDDEKVPEPEEIPKRQQKMLAAFDIYIDYIKDPKDRELVEMKFLKGHTFWRYRHYDKAIALFEDILKNHIDSEPAETTVAFMLDSLNNLRKYDDMVKWVNFLLKKRGFLEGREEVAEYLNALKIQSMRKSAEQAEKAGMHVECGERYRAIFAKYPKAEKMEEVLYNAGVCYDSGKSVSHAMWARKTLIEKYPKSKNAQRALVLLGKNYADIAYYEQAADKYEEYAKKYAGEKDASDAMSNAVFYRRGLGQDDKAIEDTEFFVKKYKRKNLKDAASALFSMTAIYEKQLDEAKGPTQQAKAEKKVISHLTRYLRELGKKGGVDRQIAAHARMGQILWQQSCPVKGVGEACIEVKRARASSVRRKRKGKKRRRNVLQTQCGEQSKMKVTVVSRKKGLMKKAQNHFRTAMKLWKGGKARSKIPGKDDAAKALRTAKMVYWIAASQFYLAEEEYERFLTSKVPEKLDFNPKKPKAAKKSLKKFLDWGKKKEQLGAKAAKRYNAVINDIKGGGEHWAIAAAARIGQISQNFSDQLFTVQIPKAVRTGKFAQDKVDAYCDEMANLANPLEEKSVRAFDFCLQESTKRNWFNNWSELCEHELGQIRPLDFPSAVEIHAKPNYEGRIAALPAALKAIDTGDKAEAEAR